MADPTNTAAGILADTNSDKWAKDCEKWLGRVLTGVGSHWCSEWDFLPVDETTPEFDACLCFEDTVKERIKNG